VNSCVSKLLFVLCLFIIQQTLENIKTAKSKIGCKTLVLYFF